MARRRLSAVGSEFDVSQMHIQISSKGRGTPKRTQQIAWSQLTGTGEINKD